VANTTRFLHKKKKPAVLMKIDISKAFDTLSWEFLIELLRRRGFGNLFCNWLCGTLRTAYTRVMITGEQGAPVQLARGVRQGDSLSPTLYILAMDSVHAIIQWAGDHGLLSDLGLHRAVPGTSIYADDVVLFFRPLPQDMEVIAAALQLFAHASGLHINLQKSSITGIHCEENLIEWTTDHFHCSHKDFPISYLGIPLTTGRLRRADIWPLIDKYSKKFKGWKPKLL
jgi:mannosylglycoprotein endo-beta-mannosidase